MLEFNSKIRKWGNSFGLIIPKEEIRNKFKTDEKVHVIVLKDSGDVLRKTFGILKNKRTMTGQQFKEKIRKDLHNKIK